MSDSSCLAPFLSHRPTPQQVLLFARVTGGSSARGRATWNTKGCEEKALAMAGDDDAFLGALTLPLNDMCKVRCGSRGVGRAAAHTCSSGALSASPG